MQHKFSFIYSFIPSRAPQFRNHFSQTVGHLGRVISPSQGLYLNIGQHKHRINAYTHQTSIPWVGFEPMIPEFENENNSCLRPRGHSDRRTNSTPRKLERQSTHLCGSLVRQFYHEETENLIPKTYQFRSSHWLHREEFHCSTKWPRIRRWQTHLALLGIKGTSFHTVWTSECGFHLLHKQQITTSCLQMFLIFEI
jgi:hypothetical protein